SGGCRNHCATGSRSGCESVPARVACESGKFSKVRRRRIAPSLIPISRPAPSMLSSRLTRARLARAGGWLPWLRGRRWLELALHGALEQPSHDRDSQGHSGAQDDLHVAARLKVEESVSQNAQAGE